MIFQSPLAVHQVLTPDDMGHTQQVVFNCPFKIQQWPATYLLPTSGQGCGVLTTLNAPRSRNAWSLGIISVLMSVSALTQAAHPLVYPLQRPGGFNIFYSILESVFLNGNFNICFHMHFKMYWYHIIICKFHTTFNPEIQGLEGYKNLNNIKTHAV